MEKPIRFGIIGTGDVATRWLLPALETVEGAQLRSVCSRSLERALARVRRYNPENGRAFGAGEYEAMLEDPELDAVIIATPDWLHAEQAIAAIEHGKHVFVEKPAATTASEVQSVILAQSITAVKGTEVRVAVGYHLRWHAGHRALRSLMADGTLGAINHIRIAWGYQPTQPDRDWRNSEHSRWWSMAALGTHCIDLAWWLLDPLSTSDLEPKQILVTNRRFCRSDETALTAMHMGNTTIEIYTSILNRIRRIEVHGSTRSAYCDETLGPLGKGTISLEGENLAFEPIDPYAAELDDFVSSIHNQRNPETGLSDGLMNVEMLEALSGMAKQWI